MSEFISEPSKVLHGYLSQSRVLDKRGYQLGMLAMALEIITRIKILEDLPVTTEMGRQESITVLHTMLVELEISDLAYEWYERLNEWRKPKFLPDESFEQRLGRALPSDVPGGPLRLDPLDAFEPVSAREEPRVVPALPESTDASSQERPSPYPGEIAIASIGELHDVASGTTPFLSGTPHPHKAS